MPLVEHHQRKVISVPEDTPVQQVASILEREAVRCVVVVDANGAATGIVTDRDLALRVVASGRNPEMTAAVAIMSHPIITVTPADTMERAIEQMARHGVRRLPVTEGSELVGIVSLDDLLGDLGSDLEDLGEVARLQGRKRKHAPSLPQLREEMETRIQVFRGRLEREGEKATDALLREFDSLRNRLRRMLG
ncbi:MAG TPA: CBS domain-containing protein [Deltaproteobacteria bacterium]|jgi:CBS domain-containing protein|nr:CBS domain-containing protein [Deltaproteobacteria bacterium]